VPCGALASDSACIALSLSIVSAFLTALRLLQSSPDSKPRPV
jgi:hypothetical protein